jgi:superfamily II DNA or RNA helicase
LKVTISNYLRLHQVPEPLSVELKERLRFVNPKWLENERMGRWNRGTSRQLKFYRRTVHNGLILPRGYMRQLMLSCPKFGIEIQMEDRRRRLPPVDFQFRGELKPFQQDAVNIMGRKDFGTLSAPTGSGKTIMALWLIAQRRQPTIIIVHNKELAVQWGERIQEFLNIPKDKIGYIGGGRKIIQGAITVALVQSLYKCASEVFTNFGKVVVDECHRAPSRTFTEAVTAFDSHYMLGLSATPWRRDGLSKLIYWHLGDVHHEINKTALVANGHLLDIEVLERVTEFKPYYDPVNEYSKMLSELTTDDARNRLISQDVAEAVGELAPGEVCLVLSDRKHHCAALKGILKHKFHLSVEILTGDLTLEERRLVVDRVRQGACQVLVATGQLIGEGFDCPNLAVLFLATPIRFNGRVIQYLGRVLRPSGAKRRARVYDYIDIHVAPLVAAAKSRSRVYQLR